MLVGAANVPVQSGMRAKHAMRAGHARCIGTAILQTGGWTRVGDTVFVAKPWYILDVE